MVRIPISDQRCRIVEAKAGTGKAGQDPQGKGKQERPPASTEIHHLDLACRRIG